MLSIKLNIILYKRYKDKHIVITLQYFISFLTKIFIELLFS